MSSVAACHSWGFRPSDLGLCTPEEDLAVMVAFDNTIAHMRGYDDLEREKSQARERERMRQASTRARKPKRR